MVGRMDLLNAQTREWLRFDSGAVRTLASVGGLMSGALMDLAGQRSRALSIYGALHRAACSPRADRLIERLIRHGSTGRHRAPSASPLLEVYRNHVASLQPIDSTAKYFRHPEKLLGPLAIVLKPCRDGEKGVIVLQYSHIFPLFAKLFDLRAVAERYYIVLEPSWSGYCDLDVICYLQYPFSVFVEAYEPRDAHFLDTTASNLTPVPLAANWWVDHRIFHPVQGATKDVDLIMVAGWAAYKRHSRFFGALATLRRRGVKPKVVLIGYGLGLSKTDIVGEAQAHGIADQIEVYEGLTQQEVNHHLNRAKVQVLWSRKEGVNRAIIEGMFAGVPCILREGFNYGYRYPYINDATGCFSSEQDLPDTLVRMIDSYETFAPREWVMNYMSCGRAAAILGESIGRVARAAGERWTGELAVKVNGLHNVYYWDQEDRTRFAADYAFLAGAARERPRTA